MCIRDRDKSMDGHAQGTEMSVRDLVSYLLGWNALVVKWIASDAKGCLLYTSFAATYANNPQTSCRNRLMHR